MRKKDMVIGAQMYTLRGSCRTPEELSRSLARVAEIGYTTVQMSGSCEYEPDWLADQLQKNRLACVITHTKSQTVAENTQAVCDAHKGFGCKYVGIGSAPYDLCEPDGYDRFRAAFAPVARVIRGNGQYFMYHNHWKEFLKDGQGNRYIERLAADFATDELGFTFDTYWAQFSGADPARWLGILSGRVPCVHLKDMSCCDKKQRMEAVGDGNMNFPAIINAASDAGTEYLLVEQDDCNGEDPFDCLARSYAYLKALGLK